MKKLAFKYLKEKNQVHDVLSFVESEVKDDFVYPSEDVIRLGDIVICYPKVFDEAKSEGKRIDEKVGELATHAANHLLGIHH